MATTIILPTTNVVRKKKKITNRPAKSWFLTWNNYSALDRDAIWTWMQENGKTGVLGQEGKDNTRHLQGIVVLKKTWRFSGLKKAWSKVHWEITRKTSAALEYCRKEKNFVEFGTTNAHRTDLSSARKAIRGHLLWTDVCNDEELDHIMAKYPRWVAMVWNNRGKNPMTGFLPRKWQAQVIAQVTSPPDDRTILWIYDPAGGAGKSTLLRFLQRNHNAVILGGRTGDILYGYRGQKIVMFDYTRAADPEKFHYGCMEALKNGSFFVSKYDSHDVCRPYNIWVVVFSNHMPLKNKFTADRLEIITLSKIIAPIFHLAGSKRKTPEVETADTLYSADINASPLPGNQEAMPDYTADTLSQDAQPLAQYIPGPHANCDCVTGFT